MTTGTHVVVALALSEEEQAVLAEIRSRGIYVSDADVLRTALWVHAGHFEIPMSPDCFAHARQTALFDPPPAPEPPIRPSAPDPQNLDYQPGLLEDAS